MRLRRFYLSVEPLGEGEVLKSAQKLSALQTQFLYVLSRDKHELGILWAF